METNRISALRNVVNAGPGDGTSPGPSPSSADPIDFAFLATQTFADRALEREVVALFVAQSRRVVPTLPELSPDEQGQAAHLLKGSARGIGAWTAAAAAERYEQAAPAERAALYVDLSGAFAEAEAAIVGHVGANQMS